MEKKISNEDTTEHRDTVINVSFNRESKQKLSYHLQ